MTKTADRSVARVSNESLPSPTLYGVHHTARPTWKLAETVRFYRDVLGLKVRHAISARGWGPDDHPDFIHFFFDSGNESTIAFFYYLNSERPPDPIPTDHWLYKSVHTAWRVPERQMMLDWKSRLESLGHDVLQVRHEILESIYVTDPNGYMVEISWQARPLGEEDALDATLTLNAAIEWEATQGRRVESIEDIWRAKAKLVSEYLAEEGGEIA